LENNQPKIRFTALSNLTQTIFQHKNRNAFFSELSLHHHQNADPKKHLETSFSNRRFHFIENNEYLCINQAAYRQ